jgi:hypothetical protein
MPNRPLLKVWTAITKLQELRSFCAKDSMTQNTSFVDRGFIIQNPENS